MSKLLAMVCLVVVSGCVTMSSPVSEDSAGDVVECEVRAPDPVPCMMIAASLTARAAHYLDDCEAMDSTEVTMAQLEIDGWIDQYNWCVSTWRYDASQVEFMD